MIHNIRIINTCIYKYKRC